MESFYGGKQGRTYNIVASYDSVEAMVEAFQLGGEYLEANYGQYVLIDTPNKNDPQNGLLFRRGFDYLEEYKTAPTQGDPIYHDNIHWVQKYNEEDGTYTWVEEEGEVYFDQDEFKRDFRNWLKGGVGGGAIYIGQIVGPAGPTPEIDFIPWDKANETDTDQNNYFEWYRANLNTYETDIQDPVSTVPTVEVQQTTVQGQTSYNYVWHDGVAVGRVNMRDDADNIVGAKLAFNFPTPVIKVSSQSVEPYEDTTITFTDEYITDLDDKTDTYTLTKEDGQFNNLVHLHKAAGPERVVGQNQETGEDIIGGGHPFYYNYNIAVPKGIKGDSISSIDLNDEGNLLNFTILNYDNSREGTPLPIQSVDFNQIKDVKLVTNPKVQPRKEEGTDILYVDCSQWNISFNQVEIVYSIIDKDTQDYKTKQLEIVNSIIDIKRSGDVLYVLFSDANYRPINADGVNGATFTYVHHDVQYRNLIYNRLAAVSGAIHLDGVRTPEEIRFSSDPSLMGILAKGWGQIPGIDQDEDKKTYYTQREGWLIIIPTEKDGEIENNLYAFDYNAYHKDPENPPYTIITNQGIEYETFWYKASGVENVSIHPQNMFAIQQYSDDPSETLREGGLWFVTYPSHVH